MKNGNDHMRIIDVDAHFHEPKDWLTAIDPKLNDEIGPVLHFTEAARAFFYPNPRVADLPEEERPPKNSEIIPVGFVEHLNLTEERHPERQEESKDGPLYSAEGRLQFCDVSGIDVQILNPTFLVTHLVSAALRGKIELIPKIKTAWNTWA